MFASRSSRLLVSPPEVDRLAVLARQDGRQESQLVSGETRQRKYRLVAEEFVEELFEVGDGRRLPGAVGVPTLQGGGRGAQRDEGRGVGRGTGAATLEVGKRFGGVRVEDDLVRQLDGAGATGGRTGLGVQRLEEPLGELGEGPDGVALGHEHVEGGVFEVHFGFVPRRAFGFGGHEVGGRAVGGGEVGGQGVPFLERRLVVEAVGEEVGW